MVQGVGSGSQVGVVAVAALRYAQSGGPNVILPVRPADLLYANFRHIQVRPDTRLEDGIPLYKLKILDTLIDSFSRVAGEAGATEGAGPAAGAVRGAGAVTGAKAGQAVSTERQYDRSADFDDCGQAPFGRTRGRALSCALSARAGRLCRLGGLRPLPHRARGARTPFPAGHALSPGRLGAAGDARGTRPGFFRTPRWGCATGGGRSLPGGSCRARSRTGPPD